MGTAEKPQSFWTPKLCACIYLLRSFSLFFQRVDDPFDKVSVRHLVLVLRRVESASKSHKGPAPNGGIKLSLEGSEVDLFAARRLHDLAKTI